MMADPDGRAHMSGSPGKATPERPGIERTAAVGVRQES